MEGPFSIHVSSLDYCSKGYLPWLSSITRQRRCSLLNCANGLNLDDNLNLRLVIPVLHQIQRSVPLDKIKELDSSTLEMCGTL